MRKSIRPFPFLLALACGLLLAGALIAVSAGPARAADGGVLSALFDSTAPVTTCDYDGVWRNAPITLRFSATDPGSGVAYTEYSSDNGGAWTRGTSIDVSAQGVTLILYRSADNDGNVEIGKSVSVILGVALYAGGNATMSGSSKVTSPLIGGQPSAAVYVNGKLTTSGSVDLSTTVQYVKAKGAVVPPLSQFMPEARIALLTQASQAAQQTGAVYKGLTYSGAQNVTFTAPITVNGNLTISGSGAYTFASVYVTGNVTISNPSVKVSFASLRVGGSLTVSGGSAMQWGPTYVAGNTTLSGSGRWNVGLLVIGGSFTLSGSQTMAGAMVGADTRPVTVLLIGQSKAMTFSNSGTFCGLLCNRYGGFTQSGAGSITGAVLCGGSFVASGSSVIAYDADVARLTLDVTVPTVTISSPADGSTVNTASPVLQFAASDDPGGSGLDSARTQVTLDGTVVTAASGAALPQQADGPHTLVVTAYDLAGNKGLATSAFTVKTDTTPPDTTPPTTTASPSPAANAAGWNNTDVTVTLAATDKTGGSGLANTYYKIDSGGAQTTYTGAFMVSASTPVTYWSTDVAGNVEVAKTFTPQIDKTLPTVADDYDRLWHKADVTVTLDPKDTGGSGVAATYYKVDVASAFSTGTSFTVAGEGSHPVVYYTTDAAGNESVHTTITVKIDKTAPTTAAAQTPAANAAGWNNTDVSVALAATDEGGSGVDKTYYTLNSGATQTYDATVNPLPLTSSSDTLTYWSSDKAGSVEVAKTFTLQIDKTSPTVTITSPADGSIVSVATPALDYSASDETGGSGLTTDPAVVTVDGEPVILTGPTLLLLADGSHTLVVTASDMAGNSGSATSTFTVATATPLSSEFTVVPAAPHEGDVVGLYADDEGNPSGSQEGKTWTWSISTGQAEQERDIYEGPVGYIVPDGVSTYDIRLTVTDVATGETSTTSKTVMSLPQAPRVKALDVETLTGQPAKLVARFLDPGWTDTHTAAWNVLETSIDGAVAEDNVAAMDSGYVSATTQALDADTVGTLAVTDSSGQVTTTPFFQITVVAPDQNRDEAAPVGNNTCDTATPLNSEQAHLSYIQSAGDVDIFEVRMPDGAAIPYGTEVLATLRDMPADHDYDLAVIQDLGADTAAGAQQAAFEGSSFASTPYRNTPYRNTPYRNTPYLDSPYRNTPFSDAANLVDSPYRNTPYLDTPYRNTPYRNTPYRNTPFLGTPYRNTPYRNTPYRNTPYPRSPFLASVYVHSGGTVLNSLDGYSFWDMSYVGLGSDKASGSDITFEELGFNNEQMAGKLIAGFSANSGTEAEAVLATTDFVGGHTYIAVKGANGAFSADQPYTLQVETSQPFDALSTLNTARDPLIENPSATQKVEVPADSAQPAETLFVTQSERIEKLYPGEWATVLGALQAGCANDLVHGEVISVPAIYYAAWDKEPWKLEPANQVAESIRENVIRPYLAAHPSIKYVVLVGSDEVVPQRRVPDQTVLGNERAYADTAFLKTDSPLFASMYGSMILTDDYYVDSEPIPFNGRSLYIPDIAVSRLVETPDEIAGTIGTFLTAQQGQLDGATAVVTGQDFMSDGAERVQSVLQAAHLASTLLPLDTWSATDVRAQLLQTPRDIGSLNAHFTHFGGISALGYGQLDSEAGFDPNELLTGTDIAGATSFVGKLIFSMGCHAGLNVPDDQSLPVDVADFGVDPSLDIAQATARRGGVLVASTGFGFGDTAGIAGTEALIGLFADQITAADASAGGAGQSIGQALAAAKRQYLGSLSTVTPYDEKSSIQFTMYGMPQYRLPSSATHAAVAAGGMQATAMQQTVRAAAKSAAQGSLTFPTGFSLTVSDGGTPTTYPATLAQQSPDGTSRYITADGDSQATADRPIQPRVVIDLGSGGVNPVRAAIVTGGAYVDIAGFDPSISRWTTEWEVGAAEFQVSTDGWWPADPVTVTTIETSANGAEQRLVVLPGQFLSTSAADAPITGTERVWTSLTVELVRGPVPTATTDNIAPTVRSVALSNVGTTWTAKVDAEDARSGIARIDVTYVGANGTQNFPFTSPLLDAGTYNVAFPLTEGQSGDVSVIVAVTDGAGNVTTATGKGTLITPPLSPGGTAPAVTSPNGGEIWALGSSQTITWTPGNGGLVDIELSRNHGADWATLFTSTDNDGTESWTVSGPVTSQALVRISNSSGSDISNADFTIAPALFAAHADYATGAIPYSVAVGDFNGDGKQDLATANPGGNSVSVLLGSGSGTFADKVDSAFVAGPVSVAVGDFDGDGTQDLATANAEGDSVSVLLGDGSGTFAAKVDYTTGTSPDSVAVGDFDGDGTQDLATANEGGNTVSVLLGDGSGAFADKADYTTGFGPYSVAVDDFDGDGTQDLATANVSGDSVSVLLGSGDGGFADKADYAAGTSPRWVAVGDFNGDGMPDLATANAWGDSVSVLLGGGSGTFAGKVDYATGAAPLSVAAGDFNGDGTQDLAAANSSGNSVSVLLNATPSIQVTTFAGTALFDGSADGPGSAASFNLPRGVACDADGNVYVADYGNSTIRMITSAGVVTTLAGRADYEGGSDDGLGGAASFYNPRGVACDADGNVYVADYGNSTIRMITSAGVVTTLAGTAGGEGGHDDGLGRAASFYNPTGVACAADGNVYVADTGNNTIRRLR